MSNYVNKRLEFVKGLYKDPKSFKSGSFFNLNPTDMRFKLGESMAELKIPFHLGIEDEEIISGAITELTDLLAERYGKTNIEQKQQEHHGKTFAVDPTFMEPQTGYQTKKLSARTFKLDMFYDDSTEKSIAHDILASNIYLDAPILHRWLAGDGKGLYLKQWIQKLIEKMLEDKANHHINEPTPYMAYLAVLVAIKRNEETLKNVRIKKISFDKLSYVVGSSIFYVFYHALHEIFDKLKKEDAPHYDIYLDYLVRTSLVAKSFIFIENSIFTTSVNMYNIGAELFEKLSILPLSIAEESKDMNALVKDTVDMITTDPAILELSKKQYCINHARKAILDFLINFDVQGSDVYDFLYDIYEEDRAVYSLYDNKFFEATSEKINLLKAKYGREEDKRKLIEAMEQAFANFKPIKKGLFSKGKEFDIEPVLKETAYSFVAYKIDEHVKKFTSHMTQYLSDRRILFDNNLLMEEYKKGRLYRFSTDTRPVLPDLTVEKEGQLFIDMKDFTYKTFKVKEAAMAEFMKDHFYEPILNAAKKYSQGTGLLESSHGIRLNGMPGDAVIFSGGVESLIGLAHDIKKIINDYKEMLIDRLPPIKEEEMLRSVHMEYEVKSKTLVERKEKIRSAVLQNVEGSREQLQSLIEEERKFNSSYRDSIENAVAKEMEAGLFITHGSKAEIVSLDEHPGLCGVTRIAIGEKINEAARGTNRNNSIRTKIELQMEKAKAARKSPQLKYPFDVFVSSNYSMAVPPEIDEMLMRVFAKRPDVNDKSIAATIAALVEVDFRKIRAGKKEDELRVIRTNTDIYNKGNALSYDALLAYIVETKSKKVFFRKIVKVVELIAEINNEYYFSNDTVDFWFVKDKDVSREGLDIFVKIGDVTFKGFEKTEPTQVFEMLDKESRLFELIVKNHLTSWQAEYETHRESKEEETN